MNKRVFLYVSGEDFSAMQFKRQYDVQAVYEEMVRENLKIKTIDTEEDYIEIKLLEFEAIDQNFIDFIRNEFIDYDQSKEQDFFEVSPI